MFEWKKWEIKVIYKHEFPKQLLTIKNVPDKLYFRGKWNENIFKKSIVIVGSRRMTRYGREVITKFMPVFIAKKITIVSGFMYGIDTYAHNECLELGGRTIAVLGSGLNYLTTIDNDKLYTQILESGGMVMSEYEPDFKATRWSFPQRNRIVAGLATVGIFVVEAGMKSGSLITARLGNETDKPVYAVPGMINLTSSEGCNWLIKEGKAKMVTDISDILSGSTTFQTNLFDNKLSNLENLIINLLEKEPLTIDEIAKYLNLAVSEISIAVSTMSMKNVVNEEMGKIYLSRF